MKLDKNRNIIIGKYRIKSNSIAEKAIVAVGIAVTVTVILALVYGTALLMHLL